jgi:maleylpyruvate isomerase
LGCPLDALPRLLAIERACKALSVFANAEPERQPDALA